MWWIVALVVASFIATLLLQPKPKFENARASSLDDLRYPTSSEGSPVPLVLGKGLIRGPNTIWAGDFAAVPIKKKMKTGLFSSKTVIIGYRYYIGLDLCLALGPCTLHRILSDKETLWTGTADSDGAAVNINLPELYGGEEKGGGFVSNCVFYTGSTTQGINAYLESKIGAGDVPAYRGFTHIVFPHAYIGETNQLRAMNFELSRYTNGLGILGGKHIVGEDMNPAETLFQAFALEFGALGVPIGMLDIPSLQAAADVLYDESNGMSLVISSPNSGKDIANEVLRQIDGIMYQNPTTGKMVLKLIRNDYVLEDLPIFDESNIIAVRQFTSKMWEDTINQVRVTFNDRRKDYAVATAIDQDLANISAQNKIKTATLSYPGVTEADLAVNLATRDLSQASVPLMGANLELNRQGANLRPGDPFIWSWGPYRIEQVVMRVKNFDLGALDDNRISIEANQDEFAVGLTIFAPPNSAGSGGVRPNNPATAMPIRMAFEAPYFFSSATDVTINQSQGLVAIGAVPTAFVDSADVHISTDTINYTRVEEGMVLNPSGTLVTVMDDSTGVATGVYGNVTITITTNELVPVAAGDNLFGAGMFMIGNEIMSHAGVTNNGDGTYTLASVRRSLLDTIMEAHIAAARVWFLSGDSVVSAQQVNTGSLRVKLAPKTYSNTLDIASAPYDEIVMDRRALRPLHPGNIKFDGGAPFVPPANGVGSKVITWSNRSRLEGTVRNIVDSNSSNEVNQQTLIRWRIGAGSWTDITVAAGVTTYTLNVGASPGDVVDYEFYAIRDGVLSRSKWFAKSSTPAMKNMLAPTLPPTGGGAALALNPADKAVTITLSNSDRTAVKSSVGPGWSSVRSMTSHTAGKWYYEWTLDEFTGSYIGAGFMTAAASLNNYSGAGSTSLGVISDGSLFRNGSSVATGLGALAEGDVVGLAIDLAAGLFWCRKNGGLWNGSGTADPATGIGGFTLNAGMTTGSPAIFASLSLQVGPTDQGTINTGQVAFAAAAPSGFTAWG